MKSISILLVGVLGAVSFGASAEAVLSCEEVDEVGVALTELGILIDDENAPIGAGTEADTALAEVTVGLAEIAEAEGDQDLANASLQMAESWDNMDREGFADALALAVAKLATISANECPG